MGQNWAHQMHVISIISLYTCAINAENFLAFLSLIVPNITLGGNGLISSILALFSRVERWLYQTNAKIWNYKTLLTNILLRIQYFKNCEGLDFTYLQALKLACHDFIEPCGRHRILKAIAIAGASAFFVPFLQASVPIRWYWGGQVIPAGAMGHILGWNLELRKLKSF